MSDSYVLFEHDTARDMSVLELIDILFKRAQTLSNLFARQKITKIVSIV